MGRLAIALAALMLAPALAGCLFEEELAIAMRVSDGQTTVVDRDRFVDGTLLVENGGTLILDGATLRIAQALIVQVGGRVSLQGGLVEFGGNYERQDIENLGELAINGTRITGLRDFQAFGGTITLLEADVEAGRIYAEGGKLFSRATDWALGPARASAFGSRDSTVEVNHGEVGIENGTLAIEGRGVRIQQGELRLRNLTMRADLDQGRVLKAADGGLVEARNVIFQTTGDDGLLDAQAGGTIRLVDAPVPHREDVLMSTGGGRIEVGWTLTARAVSPPGGIPVGGLNVTLRSAHDPSQASDEGVTNEDGEAQLVALQYVYDGFGSRSGNPHALTASGGGKHGAMTGIVMEGPATAVVPVFG